MMSTFFENIGWKVMKLNIYLITDNLYAIAK